MKEKKEHGNGEDLRSANPKPATAQDQSYALPS
jgi:hypothetical protein